ncbi:sensor histidine kinase [Granulicatella seriolae]|uniref:Histidine kinase n=1 Tax=Granulicatella seriolae TaxID=2967226 RepID=A0ABT1WMJ4_9LACT|nr:histidine kinase [Granulicatella seriolae]
MTFKQKLIKEIFKSFKWSTVMIISIFFVLVLVLLFSTKYYQLQKDMNLIEDEFQQLYDEGFQVLDELNADIIPTYMQDKNTRQLYSAFYETNNQLTPRATLLLLDDQNDLVFSSDSNAQETTMNINYFRAVIENSPTAPSMRIFRGQNTYAYLLLSRPIVENNQALGHSFLLINGNDFVANLKLEATKYAIVDEFDNVYAYTGDTELKGSLMKFNQDDFQQFIMVRNGDIYVTMSRELTPKLTLHANVIIINWLTLVIFMGVALFFIAVVLLIHFTLLSRNIAQLSSSSVGILVHETELVIKGYKTRLDQSGADEFAYLATRINMMMDTVESIYKTMVRLEEEKVIAERKMLEAQFNPHFLYNSLEAVKILVHINPKKAEYLILALNRVLRYSINQDMATARLCEDMEIIKDYLEVNQIRFDKFTYSIYVEESLENLIIPRLNLLPLIENSLKYGMKMRSDLTLSIRVFRQSHQIIFEIGDNGPGFDDEFIDNIQHYLRTQNTEHGIINSFRRMESVFKQVTIEFGRQGETSSIRFVVEEG